MFFDSHVHFDSFMKKGLFSEILERAQQERVMEMMAIGGGDEENLFSLRLAKEYPNRIYSCVGYDRDQALKNPDFNQLATLLEDPLVKGVGEIGLDYFYAKKSATEQKKLFEKNLELALQFQKPVVVHSRDADEDTLAILTDFSKAWKGRSDALGVLHCFTRGKDQARALLDLGFMISFSGIVTFARADSLRDVVSYVPDDRLLIETDSPYLAPIPHRGKQNEPSFVFHIAKQLAELRENPLELIASLTTKNAHHLFAL